MATVDEKSVRAKVRNFITETFLIGDENTKLKDSDSFMHKGVIDSTGVLELASFVEAEYSFSIEDNEMIPDNLDSIENLAKFVARKVG